jgi:ABC-type dipeptide/oligopeptide/nickel transport system permease component
VNIAAYIARRCAIAVCLLVGLTFVTFVLYDLTPIEPACVVAGCDIGRPLPAEERELIDHAIGVDRPLTTQEVLDEPYIATARAKGASESRVMLRHALRNAMRPILTMTAMEAGMAISVLLYIEVVFGIGGLGRLSLTAFSGEIGYDRPVIAAIVLFIGTAIIGLNLLVDLLYPVIDPRVTVSQERRRLVVGPAA